MHTKQTYEKSLDENPIIPSNIETHLHHSSNHSVVINGFKKIIFVEDLD